MSVPPVATPTDPAEPPHDDDAKLGVRHDGKLGVRHDGKLAVRHNSAASRFEAEVNGRLCVANYHLVDGVMRIHHTEVPPALEGRGIAGRIVEEALIHAEGHGLKVEPWCSFVRSYMERHPETQRLLPDGFRIRR